MPDPAPPFDDVTEQVREEWKADTSAFDRVRSVMRTAYEPMSAATIAEKALTSEQTARKHLRSLAEHGYVTETASPDSKGSQYHRAKDSLALEQARRILDETDVDTLSTRVLKMRKKLQNHAERFGANSPEAAVRANADIDEETLLAWRTTRRNLSFAEVALALSAVDDVSGVAEAV